MKNLRYSGALDSRLFLMPVVQTRSLEKHLLTDEAFKRLMGDANSAGAVLSKAGYKNFPQIIIDDTRIHRLLNEYLSGFIEEVLDFSPPEFSECLDILLLDTDIHNIGAALELKAQGDLSVNSIIPIPRTRSSIYKALAGGRAADKRNAYHVSLFAQAADMYKLSPRRAQAWLDLEYFRRIIEVAENSRIPLFADYARSKADFYNILTLLRLKRMCTLYSEVSSKDTQELYSRIIAKGGFLEEDFLLELFPLSADLLISKLETTRYYRIMTAGVRHYSYDMDVSQLELSMDNYLTKLCRDKKYTAIGPEPLFGYIHARKTEITNLHLIFAVLLQGLPEHTARERLRDSYV